MHDDFVAGVRDSLPVNLGVLPLGVVVGIAAVEAGLTPAQAIGMSVVVFAGLSQLAALDLIGDSAPLVIVVGTAIVINLRMVVYSASIAPHFATYRRRVRAGLAYFLTDQAYALSVAEYARNESRDRRLYYLGAGGAIWAVWIVGTVVGIVFGVGVPEAWELSFAIPLVFLALLVPLMKDRPTTAAGIAGGAVALAGAGLPFNLGLVAGTVAGIAVGLSVERGVST